MIITDSKQGWTSKVNFTDENDVFVGYDTERQCCEDAGYFLSRSLTPYSYDSDNSDEDEYDLTGYNFDVNFFESLDSSDLDEGGQVAFKLVKEGGDDLYLHLYNSHNGYYSHGFEASIGGEPWQEDCI